MAYDFGRLSEEERQKLAELMAKAEIVEDPPVDDPPEDDPPDVAVGPRLRPREELQRDFAEGVRAKGARFIARISSPKKDPIKEGASDRAEERYASRMSEVLEQRRRQRKLGKMTFVDWANEVAKLRPEDWVGPTTRKADKWGKRWEELEAIRLYAVQKLDAMPVDTAEARKAKMSANLDCMRILGAFSKGVIDAATARSQIDAATR